MPPEDLHITVLEIAHSLPATSLPPLVRVLSPAIESLVACPTAHPSRLVRPLLSFDAAALALSFVPARDGNFTYHHLRREVFGLARAAGVEIESRYVVPSAHVTVGRFVTAEDHGTREKMEGWVEGLERINEWLVGRYWPREGGEEGGGGMEWVVEDELVLRMGRLWYGGGETLAGEGVVWEGLK